MKKDKNLVLIGMPGCGKTTIGNVLSKTLNKQFIDIDKYIEEDTSKSINELFEKGEDYFRNIEKEAVSKISKEENSIISTGGGVIKNYLNIERLKQNGIIIFIDRPIENILKDIDTSNRPLLQNQINKLRDLFYERYDLYKKYCDFQVINDCEIKEIIDKIIEVIK